MFNPTTEIIIPKKIPTKESKVEIEAHLVSPEAKLQYNLKL